MIKIKDINNKLLKKVIYLYRNIMRLQHITHKLENKLIQFVWIRNYLIKSY